MNEHQIIDDWVDVDFRVKTSVTIDVVTEEGSEFFLQIDEGKYCIRRINET